jgi:hypothetical protein
MMSRKQPEHHWVGRKPDPKKYFGFVYEITCLVNGRKYIGKKQYHRWSRRKIAGPSKWEFYQSSSKHVAEDIKKYGADKFEFRILKNYKTRSGLVYGEANLQHKRDVLTKRKGDERVYYNAQITGIKWIPKEY